MSQRVLASWFSDKQGYKGDNLYDGGLYYAELSKDYKKRDFKALGGLPYKAKLKITYNGKSCYAYKKDIGSGGPQHPKIDLHENLAKRLGFNLKKGIDYVTIQRV